MKNMTWKMIYFQDSSSPLMKEMINFHDNTMSFIIFITLLVGVNMIFILYYNFYNKNFYAEQKMEMIWTVFPIFILFFISAPSMKILYMMDNMLKNNLTIKTVGNQWYWSYEYSNFPDLEFDSYMKLSNNLLVKDSRLLEVDNSLILPFLNKISMIISSSDVIHSWAVPSLSIKADAVPGRLNQVNIMNNRPGIFYGQCSEICGANHSFMPIKLEMISMKDFLSWVNMMI